MRTLIFTVLVILFSHCQLLAQQTCTSYSYKQQELLNDPSLRNDVNAIENFVHQKLAARAAGIAGKPQGGDMIIKIPVVVHIIYNQPGENVSYEKVYGQTRQLNENFRGRNADTVN